MNMSLDYNTIRSNNLQKYRVMVQGQTPTKTRDILLLRLFYIFGTTLLLFFGFALLTLFLSDYINIINLNLPSEFLSQTMSERVLLFDWELAILSVVLILLASLLGSYFITSFNYFDSLTSIKKTLKFRILTVAIFCFGLIIIFPALIFSSTPTTSQYANQYNQTYISSLRESAYFQSLEAKGVYYGSIQSLEPISNDSYRIQVVHNQYSRNFVMINPPFIPPLDSNIWVTFSDYQNNEPTLTSMGLIPS